MLKITSQALLSDTDTFYFRCTLYASPVDDTLIAMTLVFVFIIAAILLYLIADGLITGEVWVRGARSGFSLKQLAHKRSRIEEPTSYWVFIALYSIGVIGIVVILLLK